MHLCACMENAAEIEWIFLSLYSLDSLAHQWWSVCKWREGLRVYFLQRVVSNESLSTPRTPRTVFVLCMCVVCVCVWCVCVFKNCVWKTNFSDFVAVFSAGKQLYRMCCYICRALLNICVLCVLCNVQHRRKRVH